MQACSLETWYQNMKVAQITGYSKEFHIAINEIAMPEIKDHEVLVKVKASGVNPVDILIANGSIRLIQDYKFPLTLGNELAGVIEKVGNRVKKYKVGDKIMTRLPINQIGAFAEYVAVDSKAIAFMPTYLTYAEAAAIPLTGLTGYQTLKDVLKAQAGQSLFLPGGTGGLGAMVIPIAKLMGLHVITSGSASGQERMLALGADQFINYKEQNYAETLSNINYVIDTLGPKDFEQELKILKPHGKLVSLKGIPNYRFAVEHGFPFWKKALFKLAGGKYDKMAAKQQKEYHFFFVRANGEQLQKVADILESKQIKPTLDSVYNFTQISQALDKVAQGHAQGKVVVTFES
jgi:NADPH:quinone reductase-like Zn-dependent oxidoreductase